MKETLNPVGSKVGQIIDQSQRVVHVWNEMFAEISSRTVGEDWKKDGIGSCGYHDYSSPIDYGISKERMVELMEERNRTNSLPRVERVNNTCPYHRADFGCVLGDLKPPICVGHIENPREVKEKFGIDHYDHVMEVFKVLRRIHFTKTTNEAEVNPEENEDFVRKTIEKIHATTEYIKTIPV